jgi:hypothetical protein
MAHFGLGGENAVDIVVTSPGSDPVSLSAVAANSRIEVGGDC